MSLIEESISQYEASIIPQELNLSALVTGTLSVSLDPSATEDVQMRVYNENPDILRTASTIIIPAGGTALLYVQTLKEGAGVIRIGNAESTIFVNSGEVFASALPVSVSIGWMPSGSILNSLPVSVQMSSAANSAFITSRQVDVLWPDITSGTTVSVPVSIKRQ